MAYKALFSWSFSSSHIRYLKERAAFGEMIDDIHNENIKKGYNMGLTEPGVIPRAVSEMSQEKREKDSISYDALLNHLCRTFL